MSRPNFYRSGNTNSPGFEHVHLQEIVVHDGRVRPNEGGTSTFSQKPLQWPANTTWVLRSTTPLGPHLQARNDHGQSWSIEPQEEMTLDAYNESLAALNAVAVRYDRLDSPQFASEEADLVLPKESSNRDKPTRFVFNALSTVVHDRLPIPEWDENDYFFLTIMATSIEEGTLDLSQLSWERNGILKKDQTLVAAAVLACMTWEEERCRETGDEDDEADLANDHALLLTSLNLDDMDNPLRNIFAQSENT